VITEGAAKRNLKEMVYDRPEGSYKRTGRLMNTTQATGKVDFIIGEAKTGVVSKVGYAKDVLLGLGWNRTIGPRPYLTKALQDAKAAILKLGKNLLG